MKVVVPRGVAFQKTSGVAPPDSGLRLDPKTMQTNDTAVLERAGTDGRTDLEKRDVRALTEHMTVLFVGGNIYKVLTESGTSYRVDALEGRCTCPDKQYNLEDGGLCKHERRVRFATGERAIPAWVNADAVDPLLGEHIDGTPRAAITGTIEVGDVSGQSLEEARPADCGCWSADQGLPCWPCWRDGFETPSLEAEGSHEQ